jgi:hypothetical protein
MTNRGRPRIDLIGKRFGRLLVIAYAGAGKWAWSCVCDCSTCRVVRGDLLRGGITRSCGCLRKDRLTTHGMSGSREYRSWKSMKARCLNPNEPGFKYYGGRTVPITIYPDWIPSFTAWFADAGLRPLGCSLDRIDVNGNYEPGNIRWSDAKQQSQNRRPPRKRVGMKEQAEQSRLCDPPF